MRELKFRVWIKDEERYYDEADEESYMILPNGTVTYTSEVYEEDGEWCRDTVNVTKDVVVEQYTGLKDKNGKKIFTGDIIEASIDGVWAAGNAVCFGKKKWKLEVIYNDIRFMDVFRVIGSRNAPDRIYYLFDKELSELEVIGNIHEHPELLGKEEE